MTVRANRPNTFATIPFTIGALAATPPSQAPAVVTTRGARTPTR